MKVAIIGICLVAMAWLFYNFYLGEKIFGDDCKQSKSKSE